MRKFFFTSLVLLSCSSLLTAQENNKKLKDKNFQFVPVPYVNFDKTAGIALGGLPMAMYRLNKADTITPPSFSGVGVYITDKTWSGFVFQKLFLAEDKWRLMFLGGLADEQFQFYSSKGFMPYNTKSDFIVAEVQRQVKGRFYVGLRYAYNKWETAIGEADESRETTVNSFSLLGTYDSRDNVYYPRKGSLAEMSVHMAPSFLGNRDELAILDLELNHFTAVKQNKDVLAFRAYTGIALGNLNFEQQLVVGDIDLRGYTTGKYRGDQLLAVQGEYRWNFHKRMSAVGFVGLATVFCSINDAHNGKVLPGGGVGYRVLAIPKYRLKVGIDGAIGLDDWGVYFRVAEAF